MKSLDGNARSVSVKRQDHAGDFGFFLELNNGRVLMKVMDMTDKDMARPIGKERKSPKWKLHETK